MQITYQLTNPNDAVHVVSRALNHAGIFTTPATDIPVSAWLLMIKLPFGPGYTITWDLFEPDTVFERVVYEDTDFAGGYIRKTVAFVHNGVKYVPMLSLPNAAQKYPYWTGSGGSQLVSELTQQFQFNIEGTSAWGRYQLFAAPHDGQRAKGLAPANNVATEL